MTFIPYKIFNYCFYLYDISDAHFTLMLIQHMLSTWKVADNLYMEQ